MTDIAKHHWITERVSETGDRKGAPMIMQWSETGFWYHAVCPVCGSEMIYPDNQTPEEAMKDYGYNENCNEIVCALVLSE